MRFDWNAAKAASNLRKHGVSFEEASEVLFDPFAITFADDQHSVSEEREQTIGHSSKMRLLFVIHTERHAETIRIISARKVTPREASNYEETIKQWLTERGQRGN